MEAAGIHRPDVLQRKGLSPPPAGASDTPDLEVAGTITALGGSVARWRPGDRVCGLVVGGGYAEYVCAHESDCLPVPDALSVLEAASLRETCFTVWTSIFKRGALRAGESLLVEGGASGIGITAIRVARAFGHRVFAIARSAEKCAAREGLGAGRAVNYRSEDFVAVVREPIGGRVWTSFWTWSPAITSSGNWTPWRTTVAS